MTYFLGVDGGASKPAALVTDDKGKVLGDEGSAYGIARAGLSAVLRAYDGRGPSTNMLDILNHDYQLAASEIPRFVYATTTHADDIARYSKLVMQAAEDGDAVASAIL